MSAFSVVVENLGNIAQYRSPAAVKSLLVEQLGRLKVFDSTKEFLSQHHIMDVDKWSKKDRNMFVHLLKESPHCDTIVQAYNDGVRNLGEIQDKTQLFKTLNSISELTKAHPYNENKLAKAIIKRAVEWGFEKDEENLRLLQKSFNLFADPNVVRNFIGQDSVKRRDAFAFMKALESAHKTQDIKSPLLPGFSAGMALVMMSQLNPVIEIKQQVLSNVAPIIGQNATMSTLVMMGVSAYAFYKTFQTVNKTSKDLVEKEKEKLIVHEEPQGFNKDASTSLIGARIIGDLINKENFSISTMPNYKYMVLCCFANEKLKSPFLQVSDQMVQDLNLSKKEVKKLESLDYDKIHELAMVKNPEIRQLLMLGELSDREKSVFKCLSLMEDLGDIKTNRDGIYFKELSAISNIPTSFMKKYEELDSTEQAMVKAYLNLHVNEQGVCSSRVLSLVQSNLGNKKDVVDMISAQMDIDYFNKQHVGPKNEELDYLKRVAKWALTNENKIAMTNQEVKNEVDNICNKYNFTEVRKLSDAHSTILSKIKHTGEGVLANIQKLRDKISSRSSNNNNLLAP